MLLFIDHTDSYRHESQLFVDEASNQPNQTHEKKISLLREHTREIHVTIVLTRTSNYYPQITKTTVNYSPKFTNTHDDHLE